MASSARSGLAQRPRRSRWVVSDVGSSFRAVYV
jgi:hypothetical protein